MAMKLGRALLHKTKTLAGGGGGGGDEEKSEPKGVAEAVGSSNDAEAGAKPSDLKLRRGEEELLSPQQLVQYKSLLKSYEDLELAYKFFESFMGHITSYTAAHKHLQEAERILAYTLKARSDDYRRSTSDSDNADAKFGSVFAKVSQVGNTLGSIGTKHCDDVVRNTNLPLNQFNVDFDRSKEMLSALAKIRDNYISSSSKVRAMKQTSKQDLSKIQKVEGERNAIAKYYDKLADEASAEIDRIVDRAKIDALEQTQKLIEERIQYHQSSLEALNGSLNDIKQFKQSLLATPRSDDRRVTLSRQVKAERPQSIVRQGSLSALPAVLATLTNSLNFPLTIKSLIGDRKDLQDIIIDIDQRTMNVGGEIFFVDDVRQVTRIKNKNARLLRANDSDEKLAFASRIEREKFVEAFWLLKEGLDRPVSPSGNVSMTEDLKICCATWNMGDAPPKWNTDPIETWLPGGYDIYAIAAQECSYSPRHGYNSCEDDFYGWIGNHLGDDFLKLASTSLMNIRLGIFIRRHLYYKTTNLRYTTVATGLANIIGNKGAAAISFSVYETSFCFLGSHLAARIDRNRLAVRNQNYRDIISRLPFSQFADTHHEFDHFFWLGDLNYRIELSRDDLMNKVAAQDWFTLRKHDQLLNEKNMENCFVDFDEGEIEFGPTYRFDRGTRVWSEQKMREPAWCDRVLWKSVFNEQVKLLAYQPAHGLMTSDHSPLFAGFGIQLDLPPLIHERIPCHIRFTSLKGSGIEMDKKKEGKENELYITFQASWLSSSHSNTTGPASERSPNPVWNDVDVPELAPILTTAELLRRQWLRVIVRDKPDMSKSSVLGSGVVRMDEACSDKPSNFSCKITDRGLVIGSLKGCVQVVWNTESSASSSANYDEDFPGGGRGTLRGASDLPSPSNSPPTSPRGTRGGAPNRETLEAAAPAGSLTSSRPTGLARTNTTSGAAAVPQVGQGQGWFTVRKRATENEGKEPSTFDMFRNANPAPVATPAATVAPNPKSPRGLTLSAASNPTNKPARIGARGTLDLSSEDFGKWSAQDMQDFSNDVFENDPETFGVADEDSVDEEFLISTEQRGFINSASRLPPLPALPPIVENSVPQGSPRSAQLMKATSTPVQGLSNGSSTPNTRIRLSSLNLLNKGGNLLPPATAPAAASPSGSVAAAPASPIQQRSPALTPPSSAQAVSQPLSPKPTLRASNPNGGVNGQPQYSQPTSHQPQAWRDSSAIELDLDSLNAFENIAEEFALLDEFGNFPEEKPAPASAKASSQTPSPSLSRTAAPMPSPPKVNLMEDTVVDEAEFKFGEDDGNNLDETFSDVEISPFADDSVDPTAWVDGFQQSNDPMNDLVDEMALNEMLTELELAKNARPPPRTSYSVAATNPTSLASPRGTTPPGSGWRTPTRPTQLAAPAPSAPAPSPAPQNAARPYSAVPQPQGPPRLAFPSEAQVQARSPLPQQQQQLPPGQLPRAYTSNTTANTANNNTNVRR